MASPSKHEPDISNYSPPAAAAAHRMPTVSASQALQDLSAQASSRQLLTGLKTLDELKELGQSTSGIVSRGQITEIYGPPGVGKTTLAMQLAANTLRSGNHVVWVDCATHLPGRRFLDILSPDLTTPIETTDTLLSHLDHFSAPNLSHLWTLLFSSSSSGGSEFPSPSTGLIIIDSISILFTLAFPRIEDSSQHHQHRQHANSTEGGGRGQGRGGQPSTTPYRKKNEATTQQWVSSRRWAVIGDFIARLTKLSTLKNIAVVLINQTVSRVRADTGAMLLPAVSSNAWDAGVMNRVVLYRDWTNGLFLVGDEDNPIGDDDARGVRFAAVLKAACLRSGSQSGRLPKMIPFVMERNGLREVKIKPQTEPTTGSAAVNALHPADEMLLQHPTQPLSSATVAEEEEKDVREDEEEAKGIPTIAIGAGIKRKRTEVADSASSSSLSIRSGYTDLIGYSEDEDEDEDGEGDPDPAAEAEGDDGNRVGDPDPDPDLDATSGVDDDRERDETENEETETEEEG
ncbi:MAG: hypothetical protein M1823_003987 [Watsoniomyces obsoletus]|nr:MAG: hypothetical protein M1823_003987 [Watsoniomyces obsoletus]